MNNFMSLNMHIQGVLLTNKVEIPLRSQPRHLGGPTLKVNHEIHQWCFFSLITDCMSSDQCSMDKERM